MSDTQLIFYGVILPVVILALLALWERHDDRRRGGR